MEAASSATGSAASLYDSHVLTCSSGRKKPNMIDAGRAPAQYSGHLARIPNTHPPSRAAADVRQKIGSNVSRSAM